jgi:hypothetical protein
MRLFIIKPARVQTSAVDSVYICACKCYYGVFGRFHQLVLSICLTVSLSVVCLYHIQSVTTIPDIVTQVQ